MKINAKLMPLLVICLVLAFSLGAFAAEEELPFTDIDNHWSKDAVMEMYSYGIVNGYEDSTYRPDNTVTRAEFAKMLYSAVVKEGGIDAAENPFADVQTAWYSIPIISLYNSGVISGTSENSFDPQADLTREQMVTMIVRCAQTYDIFDLIPDQSKNISDFSDADQISEYAQESFTYAYQAGIVSGTQNQLLPSKVTSRAEVAQILYNCFHAKDSIPSQISQDDWVASKKFLTLDSGIRMAYVEMGQIDGEPMVLLHGTTDSSRSWSMAAQELAKTYHVYILDQRGHGATDKPDTRRYDISVNAWDLACFKDKKDIDKAHVAGHSMGSRIAQAFACNYPERVKSLTLVGTQLAGVDGPTVEGNYGTYETSLGWTENPIDKGFIDIWDSNPGPVDETFLNYVKSETSMLPVKAWQAILNREYYPLIEKISVPTLIITGGEDSIADPETAPNGGAQAVAKLIKNSVYVEYEGIGHNCQWERPERVANDIKTFLATGTVEDGQHLN